MRQIFATLLFLMASFGPLWAIRYPVHAFASYSQPQFQKMEIVGQVNARSQLLSSFRKRLLDYDTREMMISGNLFDEESLRLGDRIYIIEKDPDHRKFHNGYIVGTGEIFSIFKTEFQGWMFKARGNFSMVKKGHFIAVPERFESRKEALVFYKQAIREIELEHPEAAFALLKKSLAKDPVRPETNLEMALLAGRLGQHREGREYLLQAWNNRSQFDDVADLLRLPGIYLEWILPEVIEKKSQKEQLQVLLKLANEIQIFQEQLDWFRPFFSPQILQMMQEKGLPDTTFQYQNGRLLEEINTILQENSLNSVMEWLEKPEREILLRQQAMPYAQEKFADPRQSWDLAYLQAALYHYQLASELDPLDTRSAYHIVMLLYGQLQQNPSQIKKDRYVSLIRHYAARVLKVPSDQNRMSQVRNVLNSLSQF